MSLMLTPKALENPASKSGYNYVSMAWGGGGGSRSNPQVIRYQAKRGAKSKGRPDLDWSGPRRATALQAAQDYCDHVNSGNIIKTPDKLRFVSHPRKPSLGNSAPRTAPRAYHGNEGPGYVYLIGMIGNESAVKIGESKDDPKYRLAGLQTGCPWPLCVLGYIASNERLKVERQLHEKFATLQESTKLVGEWFPKDPSIIQHFEKEGESS